MSCGKRVYLFYFFLLFFKVLQFPHVASVLSSIYKARYYKKGYGNTMFNVSYFKYEISVYLSGNIHVKVQQKK